MHRPALAERVAGAGAGAGARARRAVDNGRAGVGAGNDASADILGGQARERCAGGGISRIARWGQHLTVMFGKGSSNWEVLRWKGIGQSWCDFSVLS
jgi:hypothetical protein